MKDREKRGARRHYEGLSAEKQKARSRPEEGWPSIVSRKKKKKKREPSPLAIYDRKDV